MDLNNTTDAIGGMLINDIFGSAVIAVIILVVFILWIAFKSNISILEVGIVFIMPTLYLAATVGFIPEWIGGVIIFLAAILAGMGLYRAIAGA